MKKPILPVLLTLALCACNNPGNKINGAEDSGYTDSLWVASAPPRTDSTIAGCYGLEKGRDTISLQLEQKGPGFSGPMIISIYEKDRNDGSFEGVLEDNILSGYYLFRSEGIMSVRQEIWKYENGTLIPGRGDVIQRGDSTIFRDPVNLKFDKDEALTKRPCVS